MLRLKKQPLINNYFNSYFNSSFLWQPLLKYNTIEMSIVMFLNERDRTHMRPTATLSKYFLTTLVITYELVIYSIKLILQVIGYPERETWRRNRAEKTQ